MDVKHIELAVSRPERDRWPDEPKEAYEATERDRDGWFELGPVVADRYRPDGS